MAVNEGGPYTVHEIFHTLQGEGVHTGRSAVFCRFSGCNLWSGREQDRSAAACDFCDTVFIGPPGSLGGRFDRAEALAAAIETCWVAEVAPGADRRRWVVLTGGEPLLQVDEPLIQALHRRGFGVAVETNGTRPAPTGLDWICVSPKGTAPLLQNRGDELKLVYPQPDGDPRRFETLAFDHFLIQPLDGMGREANLQAALDFCRRHPHWRLSLQTHKWLGIP